MHRVMAFAVLMMICAASVRAEIRSEPMEYRDGPTVLKGFLAYDDASQDTRPAVMVVPEWWGLTEYPKHRALQLAKMGYVAMVVDMYGDGKTTDDAKQASDWAMPFFTNRAMMRQRAQAGLDTLMNQKYVDKSRVAAIGYCFGGTTVIEMARAGGPLVGVISFHGNLVRNANVGPDNITAKVLVCHGADDPFVPASVVADFEKEMQDASANYQINIYSNAVHAFTNPDADSHKIKGIAYNAQADRRSWMAMNDFFAEIFRQQQ